MVRVPEEGTENLFEKIMAENFPNLEKETDIQIQKTQGVPKMMNSKRTTQRNIIIKMPKVKNCHQKYFTA